MQKQGIIFFPQPLGTSGDTHFRRVVRVSAGCFAHFIIYLLYYCDYPS